MVLGPVLQALNSAYAFLYLPAIVYGYLFIETAPHRVYLFVGTVPSHPFFQVATGICIVGALVFHQSFRLIFGDGGPSENPKKSGVALQHMFMFVTRCDISDVDPTDVGELTFTLARRLSWRNYVPMVFLGGPALGMYLLTYYALYALYGATTTPQVDSLVGGMLVVALAIVLAQPIVWGRFPNYLPVESADAIWTPEYVRGAEAAEDEQQSTQRTLDEMWDN